MLTVGKPMRGSVLEAGEGLVRLQALGKVLCALGTDAIVPDAASESGKHTSGGADGGKKGMKQRTQVPPTWNSS